MSLKIHTTDLNKFIGKYPWPFVFSTFSFLVFFSRSLSLSLYRYISAFRSWFFLSFFHGRSDKRTATFYRFKMKNNNNTHVLHGNGTFNKRVSAAILLCVYFEMRAYAIASACRLVNDEQIIIIKKKKSKRKKIRTSERNEKKENNHRRMRQKL